MPYVPRTQRLFLEPLQECEARPGGGWAACRTPRTLPILPARGSGYVASLPSPSCSFPHGSKRLLRRLLSGAILFIDEADASSASGIEVKGRRDRYANIEASYLPIQDRRYEAAALY